MNGKSNHIPLTSALDAVERRQGDVSLRAWRFLVIGQLWMLAAFVGMSLLMITGSSVLYGGGRGLRELLAMGSAGALLILLAWRGVARLMQRAEHELDDEPGRDARQRPRSSVNRSPAPAHARMTEITPTW